MAMTAAEYIIKFGVEGLQNLNIGALGFTKLSDTMRKAMQSGGAFSQSAKEAGVILNGVNSILGIAVTNYSKYDKATGQVIGKVKEYKAAVMDLNGQLKQVNGTMEKLNGSKTWTPVSGASSTGFTPNAQAKLVPQQNPSFLQRLNPFGQDDQIDVAGLIKRAAVTIPVWMAMRSAMQSVFSVIPEGINRFKDLDQAVADMSVVTEKFGKDIGNFAGIAKDKINNLSMETGKSIDELKKIYIAFSETGIDATTSFSGMEIAAKGSIATLSDGASMAKVMAGVLNNMGDSIEVGTTKSEKLAYMMALMNKLFQENSGNVDEYAKSIAASAGPASTAGVGFKELLVNVVTLNTAMRTAALGGNAIRISLQELEKNRSKVEKFLGRSVTDEEFKNYDVLLGQVITKLKKMKDSGDVTVMSQIFDMFGSRGQQNVQALLNSFDKLQSNTALANTIKDMKQVEQINLTPYLIQMDTLNKQLERSGQILPTVSKAFVAGLFGVDGKNATDALKKFNDGLIASMDSANKAGKGFHDFAQVLISAGVATAIIDIVLALTAVPTATTAALTALTAFVNSPAMARFLIIAAAISTVQSVGAIGNAFKENSDTRIEAAKNAIKTRAGNGADWSTIAGELTKDGLLRNGGIGVGPSIQDPKVFDQLMEQYRQSHQEYTDSRKIGDLGKIVINGKQAIQQKMNPMDSWRDVAKEQELMYDKMKQFGLDDIQIQKAKLSILLDDEERYKAILKLQEAITAEDTKRIGQIQSSLKDSILSNLQGKGNNIFADMGNNFKNMLQENMADNLSKVVMSSGIGSMMNSVFAFNDSETRKITDPIIQAHQDGGKAVHDWIKQAYDEVMGKGSSTGGTSLGGATGYGSGGTASMGGSLPGIWGTPFFSKRIGGSGQLDQPLKFTSGGDAYSNTAGNIKPPTSQGGISWGQLGYGATAIGGSALIAANGVSQIRGGGAKNIVGGLGSVATGIGMGAMALGSMGAFGGLFAAGGGAVATGALGLLGPIGLAIGAVLMIASLFMKGAKQNSTQTQTNETRVGSKIDVSNKKLELINRNLIALKNTMETYALATSSYYGEKNGSIDSQFALSTRRAY